MKIRFALGLLGLAAAALFLHGGTIAPPLARDDLFYFYISSHLGDLKNIPLLFTPEYGKLISGGFYHPLPLTLVMIYRHFFDIDPTWFRVFQVSLVAVTSAAMAALEAARLGPWSWLAAFLYAAHSIHSELSMLWIRDQLIVIFFLAAIALRRRLMKKDHGSVKIGIALLMVYGLAIASKETGLLLPLFLAADHFAQERPQRQKTERSPIIVLALFAGLALAYVSLRSHFLFQFTRLWGYSALESPWNILLRLESLCTRLIAWPRESLGLLPGAMFLLLLIQLLASAPRQTLYYGAWIIFIFVPASGVLPFLPLSNLLSVGAADHRLLLPMAGYAWLIGLGMREFRAKRKWLMGVLALGLSLILLSGTSRPLNTSIDWSTVLPSLSWMARRRPEEAAAYRLALQRQFKAKAPLLEAYFDGALEDACRSTYAFHASDARDENIFLNRAMADLDFQKGRRLSFSGHLSEAERLYQSAVRLDPGHAEAYLQTALIRWRLQDRNGALKSHWLYRTSLKQCDYLRHADCPGAPLLEPGKMGLAKELQEAAQARDEGIKYFQSGDALRAADFLLRSTHLDPWDGEGLLSLAVALDAANKPKEALRTYADALRLAEQAELVSRPLALVDRFSGGKASEKSLLWPILSSRAETWLRTGRKDLALRDLRRIETQALDADSWRQAAQRRRAALEER